jgi:hypothetical protein
MAMNGRLYTHLGEMRKRVVKALVMPCMIQSSLYDATHLTIKAHPSLTHPSTSLLVGERNISDTAQVTHSDYNHNVNHRHLALSISHDMIMTPIHLPTLPHNYLGGVREKCPCPRVTLSHLDGGYCARSSFTHHRETAHSGAEEE